jgi:hypothetical protein
VRLKEVKLHWFTQLIIRVICVRAHLAISVVFSPDASIVRV